MEAQVKPQQFNAQNAKRFGTITGFDIRKGNLSKKWGILDLERYDIYTDEAYPSAREAAYVLARDFIRRAPARFPVTFDENNHHHHHAMHAAANEVVANFKGIVIKENDNFDANIYQFLELYQQECLERGAGKETE